VARAVENEDFSATNPGRNGSAAKHLFPFGWRRHKSSPSEIAERFRLAKQFRAKMKFLRKLSIDGHE
jgi:hypothetical protein